MKAIVSLAVRARCWLMSALYFKASCSPPGNCAMKEVGRSGYKQGKPERVLLPVNEKPGYNNLGQWKGIQNKSRVEPN